MIPSVTGPLFIARFTFALPRAAPRTPRGVPAFPYDARRAAAAARGMRYSACTILRAT